MYEEDFWILFENINGSWLLVPALLMAKAMLSGNTVSATVAPSSLV
jgi:hypothetical protein